MINLQQIVDGLSLGGIYALAALGLAVVYRILKFMQLAHGQLVTLGAYLGLFATWTTHSLWLAALITVLVMAVLGALAYRLLFRRLLGHSHLTPLMVALGLSLIIPETLRIVVQNGNQITYPVQMSGGTWDLPGGYYLSISEALILGIAAILVVGAHCLLQFSSLGIKIRAVAANRVAAELLGIHADRIFAGVMIASFCTAGLLGVLLGSSFLYISPTFGNLIGDLALATVLAAGLGSVLGTMVTACLIGIAELIATALGYSSYIAMVPFVVIIVVLLLMPFGLFGSLAEQRN